MPPYSFDVAKSVLNESDKNRILCIFLSSDQSAVNWAKAARDAKAASEHSFRVMYSYMMKKIEKAGGRLDGVKPVAVKRSPAKGRGRKRKVKDASSDESDGEWEASKKRGRGAAGENDENDETVIKGEAEKDESSE